MTDLGDDWLDDELLHDDTSKRAWATRAVGMGPTKAMAGTSRWGVLQTKIPIEQWRIVRQHADRMGINMAGYMRAAIGRRMVSEGVDPATIPAILDERYPSARRS